MIPLPVVAAGAVARIRRADLGAEDRAMLEAMGLREGATLRVQRNGAGCIVQVDATRVALADPVARRIMVTPVEAGPRG
jgi:Fe2+ transport system protein FeoA